MIWSIIAGCVAAYAVAGIVTAVIIGITDDSFNIEDPAEAWLVMTFWPGFAISGLIRPIGRIPAFVVRWIKSIRTRKPTPAVDWADEPDPPAPVVHSTGRQTSDGAKVLAACRPRRYVLESRYQDSGWEPLSGLQFDSEDEAVRVAGLLSRDAIAYGMVRVLDTDEAQVVVTYGAGGRISI